MRQKYARHRCGNYVDKLITICTPHWGSGYAGASCIVGIINHEVCDHDLRFNSAMYGGSSSGALSADTPCCGVDYILTDTLKHSEDRSTRYYMIAAINHSCENINLNDYTFEIPTTLTSYSQISEYLSSKNLGEVSVKADGDNVVGFLSQIGWTENLLKLKPEKKISAEKIFIDVDSNGGNSLLSSLHVKIPHRTIIINTILEYLNE